ncbi:unnamed protein product [Schistocephalus solidus]|uniref:Ovule protein n=1 Tax=Schistocephalus solidus TaxID=70667 RepID=A0A183SCJ7_SCHSO|nr:unnamed protein product [Schistocephalus solidus]
MMTNASSSSTLFFSSSSTWPSEPPSNHNTLHAPNAILAADEDDLNNNLSVITPHPDTLSSLKSLPTTSLWALSTQKRLRSQCSVFPCPSRISPFSWSPRLTTDQPYPRTPPPASTQPSPIASAQPSVYPKNKVSEQYFVCIQ